MLTLTENATTEIRHIIEDPSAPDGSGVRIAADPTSGSLTLALAAVPAEDDQVLDENGARVFLEQSVATMLDDKALDVVQDPSGQPRFTVSDVPS